MRSISIVRGKIVYDKMILKEDVFIDLLSGFFPKLFRRRYCRFKEGDCRVCEMREKCAYSYIFEPLLEGDKSLVVSLPDVKIPFAFKWFFSKNRGEFILSTFNGCSRYLFEILEVLIMIGEMGLGKERMRFKIKDLEEVDANLKRISFLQYKADISEEIHKIDLESLKEISLNMPSLTMKIKINSDLDLLRSGRGIKESEMFSTLYRRIRDRMRALYVLYLDEDLPSDLKGLADKAEEVINISNKKDILEFKGNLSHFRYLFLLGFFFNVGRRCAFGKGSFSIIS